MLIRLNYYVLQKYAKSKDIPTSFARNRLWDLITNRKSRQVVCEGQYLRIELKEM